MVVVIGSIAGTPRKLSSRRRPLVGIIPASGTVGIEARTVISGGIVEVVAKAQFDYAGPAPAQIVRDAASRTKIVKGDVIHGWKSLSIRTRVLERENILAVEAQTEVHSEPAADLPSVVTVDSYRRVSIPDDIAG